MPSVDEDAIRAVQRGSIDRYAELVQRHQAAALRLAYSLLGNYADAEDAAQDAFVSAYQALKRFRGHAKFSTWLYRIVVNKCQDRLRQRGRSAWLVPSGNGGESDEGSFFEEAQDPTADPGERLQHREVAARLGTAIGQLSSQQRAAFVLHHLQGMTIEDAAEMMGCRVGTAKSHLFRAVAHVKRFMEPWVSVGGAR